MAKGSAMGLWKGKKGSSVFYQIKNSNSLQKQGVRERNYEPANPRTTRQAGQRMRMFPAQAVYGVLKETIERSWQGVKYGQMTRQAYLKSALRSEFFPAVSKGEGVIVPGPYQIAKGTLGEVTASLTERGTATIGFNIVTSAPGEPKISDLSSSLLEANPWLKEGDQVTIVLCYTGDAAIVQFNWFVGSFYINTTNQEAITQETGIFPLGFEFDWDGGGILISPVDDQFIYAAACIVSREGTTPLRSNATLSVNAAALPDYYNVQSRARARRSYMNPFTAQSTDWPVDPGEGGGSEGDYYNVTVNQVTTNGEGTEVQTPGGTVSGGGQYLVGELVTLTATADGFHTFTGWYPSKADALANTNRISTAGVLTFTAGNLYTDVTTFFGKFMPQL